MSKPEFIEYFRYGKAYKKNKSWFANCVNWQKGIGRRQETDEL